MDRRELLKGGLVAAASSVLPVASLARASSDLDEVKAIIKSNIEGCYRDFGGVDASLIDLNMKIVDKLPSVFVRSRVMQSPVEFMPESGNNFSVVAGTRCLKTTVDFEKIVDFFNGGSLEISDRIDKIASEISVEILMEVNRLARVGANYYPYCPALSTSVVNPADFLPRICFRTRYGPV